MNNPSAIYNRQHPFLASIKERYSLCKPGSFKRTHHVVLDIKGSGITYQVGDTLGIYASHDPKLVERTLLALKATGNEEVVDRHTDQVYSLREFLRRKANISDVHRKLIHELANRQTNAAKKAALAKLLDADNKDGLKAYAGLREVWDVLEEHHEVYFTPMEFAQIISPVFPRFYSIASSMDAVGEEIHLTVSYVRYDSLGHERLGVCSHYLCDLSPLHEAMIPLYVHPHHGFTLPADPNASIIMVGPGTGIAPYRGFMQQRMVTGALGRNWLFFGECNRAYDYFYEDFWMELQRKGKLRVDVAFSRDQPEKIYVQHRMFEHAQEIFAWLEAGAYFYVCGDLHHMAKDVEAALCQILQLEGKMDEASAMQYIKNLRASKRYLRDVY